jgi:hypothetical protein
LHFVRSSLKASRQFAASSCACNTARLLFKDRTRIPSQSSQDQDDHILGLAALDCRISMLACQTAIQRNRSGDSTWYCNEAITKSNNAMGPYESDEASPSYLLQLFSTAT